MAKIKYNSLNSLECTSNRAYGTNVLMSSNSVRKLKSLNKVQSLEGCEDLKV